MKVIDLQTDGNGLRFSIAGYMAAAIAECKVSNGGCLPQDLSRFGFEPDDILRNWGAAHFLITINSWETIS